MSNLPFKMPESADVAFHRPDSACFDPRSPRQPPKRRDAPPVESSAELWANGALIALWLLLCFAGGVVVAATLQP